jgi:hypothetical protein
MKVKEVQRRVHASSAFKTRHKVSLYNAKISVLMARLNEGACLPSWPACYFLSFF